jgi:hypothetical protein
LNVKIGTESLRKLHESDQPVKDVNWGQEFSFHWRSGDKILIEIQSPNGVVLGWRDYERAASIESSGVDAIKLLNGRTTLVPATTKSVPRSRLDWDTAKRVSPGGYFVECTIQEITSQQWHAFENYIKPGTKWQ